MKSPRRLTMTVMPSRKPKSYSLPALWTSYMWMSELKNENTRVMGAIMPCHNPAPARATRPSASGWLIIGFGPGAVSCIVVLGVVTCTLELGAQAAITIDNVTSKPRTRTSFIIYLQNRQIIVHLRYSNEEGTLWIVDQING